MPIDSTSTVKISCWADVIDTECEAQYFSVGRDIPVGYLIGLGHTQQELILKELEAEANKYFDESEEFIAMQALYFTADLYPSNKIKDITLKGDEFIPALRGLYGTITDDD